MRIFFNREVRRIGSIDGRHVVYYLVGDGEEIDVAEASRAGEFGGA